MTELEQNTNNGGCALFMVYVELVSVVLDLKVCWTFKRTIILTSCKKSSNSLLNLSTSSSSSWERAMSTLLKIVNSSLQRAW